MVGTGSLYDELAGDYDRHRPRYPRELFEALREHLEAGPHAQGGVVVDVGAGTGIATRLLRGSLDARFQVIGLEPGEGMRRQAVESTDPDLNVTYMQATAEDLPFSDGALAGVMVAQAVQWFERPVFYREARRVLMDGGTLAILQNNRDWRGSPFLDAYEAFLERGSPSYNRNYRAFDIHAELQALTGFVAESRLAVGWDQPMTVDDFAGMARSSSRLQQVIGQHGERQTLAAVRDLASTFAGAEGMLSIRYQSELYLARVISPS